MLKKIEGVLYMTGTSQGSMYPVVATDKGGCELGIRMELQKMKPGVFGIGFYARLMKHQSNKKPVTFTVAEARRLMDKIALRPTSDTHMSGFLGQGAVQILGSINEQAKKAGEMYADTVVKALKGVPDDVGRLEKDTLVEIGAERFLEVIGGVKPTSQVGEPQIDPTFDVMDMLAKQKGKDTGK